MDSMKEQLHIAVFPWLAAGHLNPFLELSTRLSLLGHRVSFLSLPSNLLRLPADLLPVPLLPSVPIHVGCTADVSSHPDAESLRARIRLAYDSLADPLSAFLSTASPPVDWLILDYASYWAPPLARSHGVPSVFLSLFNAAAAGFVGPPEALMGGGEVPCREEDFMTRPPKWVTFPTSVAFKLHEARKALAPMTVPDATGVTEPYRMGRTIQGCDVVAVRSCVELEEEWLEILPVIYNKLVIPIGHFPPTTTTGGHSSTTTGTATSSSSSSSSSSSCVLLEEWLDKQSHGSVVYVAFGSEVRLSKVEIHKIAHGLELSGLPFIWALRRPEGEEEEEGEVVLLPEGFEGRVRGRGLVCHGWVPQVGLLGHHAVGGFMTHCGWNSLVEGLMFGRALILMPMINEQAVNARMISEKGLGVEVPRKDDEDGSFDGDGIAKTLKLVMVEEEGECYRTKSNKLMKSVFGNKQVQDAYIRKFVDYLEKKNMHVHMKSTQRC